MTAPAKRVRRPRARPARLTARQLAALRALVACPGCGAVRRDTADGTTIVHRRDCTTPPE